MDTNIDCTILEIFTVFQSDAELQTFDIILQPEKTEQSPLCHVEHNLGLESWCVKDLYSYVHQKILTRSDPENQRILLTTALLLNPCVKTFWNMRKEIILRYDLDLYSELHYTSVVLSFKPKVQDLFNHRKWILEEIFKKRILRSDLFYNEFKVVQSAANRHVNNHMAWDFATWLLGHIELDSEPGQVLQMYWNSTEKWILSHVSDFSGMNFRQQLIRKLSTTDRLLDYNFKRIIATSCNKYLSHNFGSTKILLADKNVDIFFIVGVVLNDFELIENLISFYVNHEALWTQMRFLSYMIIKFLPEKLSNDEKESFNEIIKEYISNTKTKYDIQPFYVLFIRIHELFLSKVSAKNDDSFIQKYQKWLRYLGFDDSKNLLVTMSSS